MNAAGAEVSTSTDACRSGAVEEAIRRGIERVNARVPSRAAQVLLRTAAALSKWLVHESCRCGRGGEAGAAATYCLTDMAWLLPLSGAAVVAARRRLLCADWRADADDEGAPRAAAARARGGPVCGAVSPCVVVVVAVHKQLKRSVIEDKYRAQIARVYGEVLPV